PLQPHPLQWMDPPPADHPGRWQRHGRYHLRGQLRALGHRVSTVLLILLRAMRRFTPLLAKEGPKGSGGSPRGQGASGTSWVAPEAPPSFLPVDGRAPKYGDLVRLKYGDTVKQ